jgi:hypothetical protein
MALHKNQHDRGHHGCRRHATVPNMDRPFEDWPLLKRLPPWAQYVMCFPIAILLVGGLWVAIIGSIGIIETWVGASAAAAVLFGGFIAAFLSRMK